ncbi:hypothetical protein AB0M05_07745 [Streptomyces violaceusniger]|uniref:hypothetical protein n=1 Tax=Streptomyces violaceusniger TaxID=68280 RepID=UPI00342ED586
MAHLEAQDVPALKDVYVNNVRIMRSSVPQFFDGDMLFVSAERKPAERETILNVNLLKR